MANICCDDIYFYSESNPEHLNALREDLEASIIFCHDENLAWLGHLFQSKEIPADGIPLRGEVIYMERNEDSILLSTSAAWSPLYDAYCAIADAYHLSFVMQSIEPGCGIYINTDHSGRYFPDHYTLSVDNEDFITPAGIPVCDRLEYGEMFSSDTDLLGRFAEIGYQADTIDALNLLLEDTGISIHVFTDPYSSQTLQDWRNIHDSLCIMQL